MRNPIREYQPDAAVENATRQGGRHTRTAPTKSGASQRRLLASVPAYHLATLESVTWLCQSVDLGEFLVGLVSFTEMRENKNTFPIGPLVSVDDLRSRCTLTSTSAPCRGSRASGRDRSLTWKYGRNTTSPTSETMDSPKTIASGSARQWSAGRWRDLALTVLNCESAKMAIQRTLDVAQPEVRWPTRHSAEHHRRFLGT